MTDRTKEILTIFAAFIAGFGPAYFANPDPAGGKWIGWVVSGLVSLGAWVTGYTQTNPRLQPRTPEALLEAVKRTDLAPSVKGAAAEALGSAVTADAAAPAPPKDAANPPPRSTP